MDDLHSRLDRLSAAQRTELFQRLQTVGPHKPSIEASPKLVAYVVARSTADFGELRGFLAERLPSYMQPAALVRLDAMPLLPNGKVDIAALPEPDYGIADRSALFVAPQTRTEQALAGIWRELLAIDRVGLADNFFDLGGHSLLLIRLRGRLREKFGRDVPIVELFRHPTIGKLAGYLSGGLPAADAVEAAHERALKQRAALRRRRAASPRADVI